MRNFLVISSFILFVFTGDHCVRPLKGFNKALVYSDGQNKTTTLIDLTGGSFTSKVLLYHFGIQQPASIDYFPHENRVYWSDILQGMILSVFTNGTSMKVLFSCDVIKPLGMVIDKAGRNLYWTDSGTKRIEVGRVDGTKRKVLITDDVDTPIAIILDIRRRLLYWTDVGKNPKIEQAAMDGTSRRVIVNENLGAPNGLTMDHSSNRLYWIDAKLDRIEEFDLNNRNRRVILSFTTDVSPFGLAMNQDWLYWSDWKTKTISRVSTSRGKKEIIAYGLKLPMDLFVYDAAASSPDSSPCSVRNGLCSDFCLLNPTGYKCACPTGVTLLPDGKNCDYESFHKSSSGKFLLFAGSYSGKIYNIPLAVPGKPCNALEIESKIVYPIAVDYDPSESKVYWTDGRLKAIIRAFLNGSSVEVIVEQNIQIPDGLAIDWIGRNMYWSDAGTERIEVSRLDGSSRRGLITTNIEKPRSIALDIGGSIMFWTDWGSSPKIEKANMDGTARQVLVSSGIVWVNAISLDLTNKVLFWCDARLDRIEKIDFQGNNREVVFVLYNPVGGGFFHQFGLAVHDDILYWTDWVRKSVIEYNTKSHRFDKEWKGITRPMGLRVYDSQKLFKGSNSCSNLNGGCSNLCLQSPHGYRCFCPEGVSLIPGNSHICQGAVKCPSLSAPPHGILQGCDENTKGDYLTTCRFSCSVGYIASGSEVRTCLRNSRWSGEDFSCRAIRCPHISVPSNAVLLSPSCGNLYGANCVFGCQYGYASNSGNVIRTCSQSGNWNGSPIKCADVLPPSFGESCPMEPLLVHTESGQFSAVITWTVPFATDNSGIPPEVTSNFKDPPHRMVEGSHVVIYTATDKSGNKKICSITIKVVVIYCPSLTVPSGDPLLMGSCGNHNGAECLFSCATGYRLIGSSVTRCIAHGNKPPGSWNKPLPSCEVIRCPSLPVPLNGGKTGCSNQIAEVYGVRCSFFCNVGYYLTGSSVKYCMENGTWSGQTTSCKAIRCHALVPPRFGALSPASCLTKSGFGQECTFTCQDGYTLEGTSTRVCANGGNWTGENNAVCTDLSSPTFNGTCPSEMVFYTDSCEDSAVVSWSDPVATDNSGTTVMTYPPVRSPVNLTVGLYEIFYTATDKSGNTANCSFVVQVTRISCPALDPPLHGSITSLSCGSYFGSQATFSCNIGYQLAGSDSRTCQSNGTWSGNAAVCNVVRCPSIKAPAYGDVIPDLCKSLLGAQYGDSCFFICNSSNGYQLEGPQNVLCQHNGSWSTNTEMLFCKDVQRPQIQCPENIEVETETGQSYATVNWTIPAPSDNSNGTLKAIGLYPPQQFEAGRTEILYKVMDSAGLTSSCKFTVHVRDTEPPRFRHCPSNMQVISGKKWSKVLLPPSYHTDNVGVTVFSTNIRNGSELTWGQYSITYAASDKAGNTANCTFHISIAGSPCEELEPPLNGAKACETWLVGMHCTVHCNRGYSFATDPQKLYFCTPKGHWVNAKVEGEEKPALPDCSEELTPKDALVNGQIHYLTEECGGEESKRIVARNFITLFKQHPMGFLGGCVFNEKCTIENVRVECGSRKRLKRESLRTRRKSQLYFQVKFTIKVPLVSNTSQDLNKTSQELSQTIASDLHETQLDLDIGNKTLQADKSISPVVTIAGFACDKGQVKRKNRCVSCPIGYFHNASALSCQICPMDHYQDKEAQSSCIPCPKGRFTRGKEGSKLRDDCRACPKLGKPFKGYKNCSMASGRNVCTLTCRKGHSFHEEAETAFVCGPDTKGIWNGLNKVKLPKCSTDISPSQIKHRFSLKFPNVLCRKSRNLQRLPILIQREVWTSLRSVPGCTFADECQVRVIKTHRCRTVNDAIEILFLVSIKSSHLSLQVAIEDTSEAVLHKLKEAFTTGKFTISVDGIYITVEKSSLKHLSSQLKCAPGSVLLTTKKGCVACPVGTFYDKETLNCKACGPGSYQDREGQTSCLFYDGQGKNK